MQMIDLAHTNIVLHPQIEDESISEPCSEVRVGFREFDRRAPSSIEKALYGAKPCVTFEVFVERGSSFFTSSWLCY